MALFAQPQPANLPERHAFEIVNVRAAVDRACTKPASFVSENEKEVAITEVCEIANITNRARSFQVRTAYS